MYYTRGPPALLPPWSVRLATCPFCAIDRLRVSPKEEGKKNTAIPGLVPWFGWSERVRSGGVCNPRAARLPTSWTTKKKSLSDQEPKGKLAGS